MRESLIPKLFYLLQPFFLNHHLLSQVESELPSKKRFLDGKATSFLAEEASFTATGKSWNSPMKDMREAHNFSFELERASKLE